MFLAQFEPSCKRLYQYVQIISKIQNLTIDKFGIQIILIHNLNRMAIVNIKHVKKKDTFGLNYIF